MSTPELDLRRARDIGGLLDSAVALYRRFPGVFISVSFGIVLPVELIVNGVGLGQFTRHYDSTPPLGQTVVPSLLNLLVLTPLITAMHVRIVQDVAEGKQPDGARAVRAGLDVFAPLVGTLLLMAVLAGLGLVAFIIPGLILVVHWIVVPQTVVIEGRTFGDALRRSWSLVSGHAWWVLGVVVVNGIVVGLLSSLVSIPATALAKSDNTQVWQLGARILTDSFSLSFSALVNTLLYFTLRVRKGETDVVAVDDAGAFLPPRPGNEEQPVGWEPPRPAAPPSPPEPVGGPEPEPDPTPDPERPAFEPPAPPAPQPPAFEPPEPPAPQPQAFEPPEPPDPPDPPDPPPDDDEGPLGPF